MASIAQAQADGVVVGLKSVSDVQPRREIDDLVLNEPDVFNLFLLALESLQKNRGGKEDKMSYFAIAGIHGFPRREWDNVKVNKELVDGQMSGYCIHGSVLFPTWHRPYVAMMEQSIYSKMEEIAAQFEDRKYRSAARKFRLPYWDYFHPREQITTEFPGVGPDGGEKVEFPYDFRLPRVLGEEQLMVYRPKTQEPRNETELVPMNNPLRTFWFPETDGIASNDWKVLGNISKAHTVRYPTPGHIEKDRPDKLNDVLNMRRDGNVQDMLNFLRLPHYTHYSNFATVAEGDRSSGSLEDFHNTYHVMIGGTGHMSRTLVAAFDPIFWLHHCNIDRILAVWQTQNTDYVTTNATIATANASTSLYPFRKSTQSFWNSADSRRPADFGYTYPDLLEDAHPDVIKNQFIENYVWSTKRKPGGKGKLTKEDFDVPADMQPVDVTGAQVFYKLPSTVTTPSLAVKMVRSRMMDMEQQIVSMDSNGRHGTNPISNGGATGQGEDEEYIDDSNADDPTKVPSFPLGDEILRNEPEGSRLEIQWYIDVEVNKDAMNGSFTIFHFVGPLDQFDEDPTCWQTLPILAGLNHILASPIEACDNCARQSEEGLKVTGTSAITPILLDYIQAGRLESLRPSDVEPFLKRNMIWRVADVNQQQADLAQVSGLAVSVSATISVLRPGSAFPEFNKAYFPQGITADHRSGDPVLS